MYLYFTITYLHWWSILKCVHFNEISISLLCQNLKMYSHSPRIQKRTSRAAYSHSSYVHPVSLFRLQTRPSTRPPAAKVLWYLCIHIFSCTRWHDLSSAVPIQPSWHNCFLALDTYHSVSCAVKLGNSFISYVMCTLELVLGSNICSYFTPVLAGWSDVNPTAGSNIRGSCWFFPSHLFVGRKAYTVSIYIHNMYVRE